MRFLDRTFSSPEENLACDEALLDMCEEGYPEDLLRVWESPVRFVVLGYANSVAREVFREACISSGIPILRRCSGGGTVLQGPGCLNYALLLHIHRHPVLHDISSTNRYILERHAECLRSLIPFDIQLQGHTDLALQGSKFSGNSQRRKGKALLFHGTMLYDFPLDSMHEYLPFPSVEPSYRHGRSHSAFLTNIPVDANGLRALLRQTWGAGNELTDIPYERIARLVREKYSSPEWTFRR